MRALPFVLLAVAIGFACAPPPEPAATSGTIGGKVTVEDGDLRGVLVSIPGRVEAPSPDGSFSFTGLAAGAYSVTATKEGFVPASAEASVLAGLTARVELSLAKVVADNEPPVLVSLSSSPSLLARGERARLLAVASDADGDALSFAFSAGEGWTVSAGDEPGTAQLVAPDAGGAETTVSVKVTDGRGGETQGSILVSTTANRAPVIAAVLAAPPQLAPGAEAGLHASASDPEGDTLTYEWSAPEGWTIDGTGERVRITAPASYDAVGLVTVVVTDEDGARATGSTVVTTTSNLAPVFASLVARPNPARPGATVSLVASASDPNGDALSWTWSAGEAWNIDGTGPQVTITAPTGHDASTLVEVTADDGHGLRTTASIALATTPNAAPIVQGLAAVPSQAAPGGEVRVSVSATDPDGEPLTFAWTAPEGWTVRGAADAAEAVLVAPADYGASGIARVVVGDGSTTVSAGVVVATRPNASPAIASIVANPTTVVRGGNIDVRVSANDPDGDALTYEWTAPSGWVLAGTGAQVRLTAPATSGTSGTLAITVRDGHGGESSGQVLVSTLANRAPLLASLSSTGSPAGRRGTITLAASATDPDGDPLAYEWSAPAGWALTASGASATVIAPDEYAASALVSLTVSDGAGGSTKGSTTIATAAANRPPTLGALAVSPAVVNRGGNITASISAEDADGDPLAYTWTVPAGWTTSGSGRTITIKAPDAYASSGFVRVDVSDGIDPRSASAAIATRANNPPVISSFAPSAPSVLPGASVTLAVTATDADGEPITYAYAATGAWTIAGTGASVTLRAPFTNDTSTTVTVTAGDGFGGTATKTVTVATSACAAGAMNCDGDPANGCEASLQTDDQNCGVCANGCTTATHQCRSGSCVTKDCMKDWLTGTQCNGVDYGGGCTSAETGYHWRGFFTSGGTRYACWWHTKNQAWNTSTATNLRALALQFKLTPTGGSVWCHARSADPCASGGCSANASYYFESTQVGAWGWCGGSNYSSGGFACIPAPTTAVACQ